MELDPIYCGLGRYIIAFQALDNELREIIWFCLPREVESTGTAGKGFDITLQRARAVIGPHLKAKELTALLPRFSAVYKKCSKVQARRNRIVHSVYQHHETAEGQIQLVRTYVQGVRSGKVLSDSPEEITEQTLESAISDVWEIYGELFELHKALMNHVETSAPYRGS